MTEEATQIGILIGEVKGIKDLQREHNTQLGDLTQAVGSLPCGEHSFRLKAVEKTQENRIINSRLKKAVSSNLKAHCLAALAGAGITSLVWFLIRRLA